MMIRAAFLGVSRWSLTGSRIGSLAICCSFKVLCFSTSAAERTSPVGRFIPTVQNIRRQLEVEILKNGVYVVDSHANQLAIALPVTPNVFRELLSQFDLQFDGRYHAIAVVRYPSNLDAIHIVAGPFETQPRSGRRPSRPPAHPGL